MQPTRNNPGAIVSNRIIPGHQLASIIAHQGWKPEIFDRHATTDEVLAIQPDILIADIDDHSCRGIDMLHAFRRRNPLGRAIALCTGGGSPAMRAARRLGVDGFFYLNSSGLALDPRRGMLPILLQPETWPVINPLHHPGPTCPVAY